MTRSLRKIIIFFLGVMPLTAMAELSSWTIVPKESSLSFTGTQNNAPVTGQFKQFSGEITADPARLDTYKVKITVDINSVFDAYNQLSDTLKTTEWFNAKQFPQAIFQANQFLKTGDKTFEAKGNLTIRDKTLPVTLNYTEEEATPDTIRVKGSTIIKRSAFGVGTGEWADTSLIKDEVQVDFRLSLIKK